jgi:hypothetical protein
MTKQFTTALNAAVKLAEAKFQLQQNVAFLLWFGINILDLSEDEALEAASIGGSNDKGIDFFHVDDEQGRVIVAQGKYSPDMDVTVKESHLSNLESSLNWLANPESLRREGKADLAQTADDYTKAVNEGYGVELWFIYTAPRKANIDKKIHVYNANRENIENRRFIRHLLYEAIYSVWLEQQEGRANRIDTDNLALTDGTHLQLEGHFGKAVIMSVPAQELVRLYTKYGDLLFDRNVRLFLGTRKDSVNAGISDTLQDPEQRGNFWAYNNGITIICDSYQVSDAKIVMNNFSIINGCQTTVSLANASNGLAEVDVLTRLINAPQEVVDDIIRFNNSQNPIKMWDIASQNKTQRRLRREFERLSKPYIYLTRRGSRPASGLKKFRDGKGKLRQVQIDVAGQYAAAFRGMPVVAYNDKGLVFTRYHDQLFPPDIKVEEVLFECVCGDICRRIVIAEIANGNAESASILKKGGTYFVLATVARILELRNGATFMTKMNERQILSPSTERRLEQYARFAVQEYVQGVADQSQIEGEELPTLVRSPAFFDKVRTRVERSYKTRAIGQKWLDEVLPMLGTHGR